MSRRHSMASARRIARVMRRELEAGEGAQWRREGCSRSCPWVSGEGLCALCPRVLFELCAEFVNLSWPVRCIVSETGELLGIRTKLGPSRGQRRPGRIAGRDQRHVIGSEDVHEEQTRSRAGVN